MRIHEALALSEARGKGGRREVGMDERAFERSAHRSSFDVAPAAFRVAHVARSSSRLDGPASEPSPQW